MYSLGRRPPNGTRSLDVAHETGQHRGHPAPLGGACLPNCQPHAPRPSSPRPDERAVDGASRLPTLNGRGARAPTPAIPVYNQ